MKKCEVLVSRTYRTRPSLLALGGRKQPLQTSNKPNTCHFWPTHAPQRLSTAASATLVASVAPHSRPARSSAAHARPCVWGGGWERQVGLMRAYVGLVGFTCGWRRDHGFGCLEALRRDQVTLIIDSISPVGLNLRLKGPKQRPRDPQRLVDPLGSPLSLYRPPRHDHGAPLPL